jgi:hypothetical protein
VASDPHQVANVDKSDQMDWAVIEPRAILRHVQGSVIGAIAFEGNNDPREHLTLLRRMRQGEMSVKLCASLSVDQIPSRQEPRQCPMSVSFVTILECRRELGVNRRQCQSPPHVRLGIGRLM